MNKEVQKALDKWYQEYVEKYNRFPTWGELLAAEENFKKNQKTA